SQTPRIFIRQRDLLVQSSASGASRTPRSSRIRPSNPAAKELLSGTCSGSSPSGAGRAPLPAAAAGGLGSAADTCAVGAQLGLNLVICFHERTTASAKISNRSPG